MCACLYVGHNLTLTDSLIHTNRFTYKRFMAVQTVEDTHKTCPCFLKSIFKMTVYIFHTMIHFVILGEDQEPWENKWSQVK